MDQFINTDRMMIRGFKAGEWVFHEGDIGDCAYLVETLGALVSIVCRDALELVDFGRKCDREMVLCTYYRCALNH